MPNNIKLFDTENNIIWEKQLGRKEIEHVKGCLEGRDVIAIIPATFKPVRTNNLKNFSKDFFLPTTINQALKVHNTARKIFAILGALVLDALTFPVRLLTCIPRVILNALMEEHSLRKYLIDQGIDEEILASDHVLVQTTSVQVERIPILDYIDEWGIDYSHFDQESHWEKNLVNFIELPIYEGYDYIPESGIN